MRFRGHPIHPMLVHFPIAFWSTAGACDVAGLFYRDFRIVEAAYACIALGVVAGLVAAAAGFMEYAAVPTAFHGCVPLSQMKKPVYWE